MQYLRLLLLPFSCLYGLIGIIRNFAYQNGVFASRRFDVPVISIGNLAIGGAGKSPMAEYIIRLLSKEYRVAVLSRGYGRTTKGYRLVSTDDSTLQAGDEPLQFKKKFPEITVAVCEKRVYGIEQLQDNHDVIILDDAFQHRAVVPGLSLLLFDYTSLDNPFIVLPAGDLREPFMGRERADILVITKSPLTISDEDRKRAIKRVKPFSHQQVFFSYLKYGDCLPLYQGNKMALASLDHSYTVYLLTGIANPKPLLDKLAIAGCEIRHYDYPDHHPFCRKNISKLAVDFSMDAGLRKIIITTEKDVQRLRSVSLHGILEELPVFYIPIQAEIHPFDNECFNSIISKYVKQHL
ncbi:Tetraacyldisaccharide 4'-kinase [Arcticibacter svalbardensis MN12-7]|uniref:Tetraacyldisaccharide 4'-kinase n=1 Tax=Arcticibacter svalbardensis MN12-7 TaxID=1150600 RepID=R9GSJ7_9SPHI|nr:tetraacyldisaccharide 4'-kinase [Arcticibacter svalbardensis]EOR94666.1 Tetraacyldisaccharide 4'-kinase [Arcticibacter svalbardensis MN12-7]